MCSRARLHRTQNTQPRLHVQHSPEFKELTNIILLNAGKFKRKSFAIEIALEWDEKKT